MANKSETLLHSLFDKWGLKGVLFDLDDTLIKTHEVFLKAIQEVVDLYSLALPELDAEVVARLLYQINIDSYQYYAVSKDNRRY